MSTEFNYEDLLPIGPDKTEYRKISDKGLQTFSANGREFLEVAPEAIANLTEVAMHDISHYLRAEHLKQLQMILDDPESSGNDRFVALDLLKNANISAGGVLPMCQDTGTAIVMGKKGQQVLTTEKDEVSISRGVFNAFTKLNLRYSQLAPTTVWEEKNTGNNLPAQIEIYSDAEKADEYNFLFIAKGGGSANKSFLYQETKAILNPTAFMSWLEEKLRSLGTSACPPYHLVVVIGGTSAEHTLKTAKLASTKYLDSLPTSGDAKTGRGFRDKGLESQIMKLTQGIGIGAQFGGKYFCHDVRVVRLPRHGASLPIAIAVSCSADRQAKAKINKTGVYLEKLETDPSRFLPNTTAADLSDHEVKINLNGSMKEILAELSKHPVKTRVLLSGKMIVARDLAHAKIKELIDYGKPMPDYFKNHAVYYAGPAKTPAGFASGSFGPTTAGRMDSYVEKFQSLGGSMIMLAKGNRSKQVSESCKKYGGFYLGSIGGPAAKLAQDCIKKVETLAYPELGMEAIWQIEVENFPAFIIIDDKGNDFYEDIRKPLTIGKKPN